MKPLPWSYTALDDFVNCPRAYFEKRVAKSVVEVESEQMRWGTIVHKHFELRQLDATPLPLELLVHEPFMQKLDMLSGIAETEQKIALNRRGLPCAFFDKTVWFRGVVDYRKRHGTHAIIVDYKTGKPHQKFGQLKLFALHTMAQHPDIDTVAVKFYWTQTQSITGAVYTRSMLSSLWQEFVPNLKQYAEAFRTDTWQPRPSGLCYGWCPVTLCEFWKPKRQSR